MSDQEKMREEFESEALKIGFNVERADDGDYLYIVTREAWILWQASRSQSDAEIAKRDSLITMQAEALNGVRQHVSKTIHSPAFEFEKKAQIEILEDVISASAQSVAAWEAEKLLPLHQAELDAMALVLSHEGRIESLQRQVAMLRDALQYEADWHTTITSDIGGKYKPFCSTVDALSYTQATAEAYDREHAAKVLEDLAFNLKNENAGKLSAFYELQDFIDILHINAATSRAQSAQKKEGEV